jgi:hypothetical protein
VLVGQYILRYLPCMALSAANVGHRSKSALGLSDCRRYWYFLSSVEQHADRENGGRLGNFIRQEFSVWWGH